jgi:hypothetical protein
MASPRSASGIRSTMRATSVGYSRPAPAASSTAAAANDGALGARASAKFGVLR